MSDFKWIDGADTPEVQARTAMTNLEWCVRQDREKLHRFFRGEDDITRDELNCARACIGFALAAIGLAHELEKRSEKD